NTVQSLVVERKKLGRKAFFEVCGKDGFPCLVRCFAVKQTCVNAVSSGGNSDVSVMVGCPYSNVARVFSDKLQITGLDIQPVSIKDLFVPPVQAHNEVCLVIWQVIDHLCPDTVKRGQIPSAGAVAAGHEKMKVFVSAIILQVQKIFISFPEEAANVAIL